MTAGAGDAGGGAAELEVVVARFREDVRWTRNLPRGVRVTVYDKGGDLDAAALPRARVERLPNLGFEAHTYLHHLVAARERLAPVTLFCQGHPFDHAHDLHAVVRALAGGRLRVERFLWLGFILDSDDARGRRLFVPWRGNRDGRELALDRFHRELLGEPSPDWVRFRPGAQFAVSADAARSRPAAFYRRALALATSFPDAGHCFERLWDRVFAAVGIEPGEMGGEPTRYLKPIRRLAAG